MKKLTVGDVVQCRYFNTPDGRFFGEIFTAEIISLNARYEWTPPRDYVVMRLDDNRTVTVDRKEILRRITPPKRS